MIKEKYLSKIKEILQKHLENRGRVFIFGSSAESEKFGDVDLAIISEDPEINRIMREIREELEESALPYKFDVVNFNQAKKTFRDRVMNGPKIWII